MHLKGTLTERDGELFVAVTDSNFFEPEILTVYYPLGDVDMHGLRRLGRESLVGVEGTLLSGGRFSLADPLLGFGVVGRVITFTLKDGSQTKPTFSETRDYPCPRVRKGTQTWYRNGRWMKLSKREGWIPA